MAELVNLRQARKTKQRAAKEQQAADNRLKFGRTKAERKASTEEASRLRRQVDASKLDKS